MYIKTARENTCRYDDLHNRKLSNKKTQLLKFVLSGSKI